MTQGCAVPPRSGGPACPGLGRPQTVSAVAPVGPKGARRRPLSRRPMRRGRCEGGGSRGSGPRGARPRPTSAGSSPQRPRAALSARSRSGTAAHSGIPVAPSRASAMTRASSTPASSSPRPQQDASGAGPLAASERLLLRGHGHQDGARRGHEMCRHRSVPGRPGRLLRSRAEVAKYPRRAATSPPDSRCRSRINPAFAHSGRSCSSGSRRTTDHRRLGDLHPDAAPARSAPAPRRSDGGNPRGATALPAGL